MNWRTDKPTADVIVAEIKDRGYKIMYASNYDTFHYLDDNGEEYEYTEFVKWADLEEDETVIDCNEYSTVEEELDAFIKSGKAIKEENCGSYTTTYIDPLKVARHFAKWGAKHLRK